MRPCEGRGGGFNSPPNTLVLNATLSRGFERWVYETRLGRFDSCTTYCWPGPRQGTEALNLGRAGSTPALASSRPAMLDRPSTALVKRPKWVRVPPPAPWKG